jgi:serine/threonine-protein kinase
MHPEVPDERLDALIADYLQACEAGRAPDRRELLARHPGLAAGLNAFFADHDEFGPLVSPLRDLAPRHQAEPPPRSFAGYELLEELGRGGMGVVYKARQAQPQRLVALKMILGGAFASPADVERFRREADLVAGLDHPNIVPIHEVGVHEGRHYFTMKLVEGGSLARHLSDFRGDFPAAARLVATVARAVQHAHERGVLHRDLKPANILLAACGLAGDAKPQAAEYVPHVTDFGLARRLTRPADSTTPGTAVGTPSYMAPEQASGDGTTAADVYALGAILYELLAGRPPFRGDTPLDTLMQVLEQEPPRPRLLQPRLPRDLETVCLKCLRKDPRQRYGSARELAEDLERFLAGEPVAARPAGRGERLGRWCRRNPLAAGLLAALVLALAGGLAAVTWQWRRADASAADARSRWQEAEAERRRAEREREEAEESFRIAYQAVKDFADRARDERLVGAPGVQAVRRAMLQDALRYYRTLIERHGHDPRLDADLADAHFHVARLTSAVGTRAEALAAYERARALYDQRLRAHPDDATARLLLARTCNNMGAVHGNSGNREEALRSFGQARDILEAAVGEPPLACRTELGRSYGYLGVALRLNGRPAEALPELERSRDLLERLRRAHPGDREVLTELAGTHSNLAFLRQELGRLAEALTSYQEARQVHDQLAGTGPPSAEHQRWLAGWHRNVGALQLARQEPAAALESFREAARLLGPLAEANPNVTDYQLQLAAVCGSVGAVLMETGELAQVQPWYDRALQLQQALVRYDPQVGDYQHGLAKTYANLAVLRRCQGQWEEALAALREAQARTEPLARAHPNVPDYQGDLGRNLGNRGMTLELAGRRAEALAAYREAVAALRRARALAPQLVEYQVLLGLHCGDVARLGRALGREEEAAAAVRERAQLWSGRAAAVYQLAREQAVLAGRKGGDGAAGAAQQRLYADQAVGLLRAALELGFADGDRLRTDPQLDGLRDRDDFRQLLADPAAPTREQSR